jgi:hypothetical protein
VTLFDELLQRVFNDRLVHHLPHRVMPISAEPPQDIQVLIDEEFSQIHQLLQPGKRRRPEARARIRSLLALESHLREEATPVSSKDVDRVERAVRANGTREQIFPALTELGSEVSGEGVEITVHFTKKTGAPVHFVGADEDVEAGAVREVDLQRKYHQSGADLAAKLSLSPPRCLALRRELRIDDDPSCRHDFVFGSQRHPRYSDNAYTKMKARLDDGIDMDLVWKHHGPRRRSG